MTKLEHYAHLFGLPVEQIHFLAPTQQDDVARHKRAPLIERRGE